MKINFRGRLVVVTGASSGIGREIARELAVREGADLLVVARRLDNLEGLKREIQGASDSRVQTLSLDLASPGAEQALFQESTRLGTVFALVNCAGATFYGKTLEAPREKYDQIVSLNFISVMKASMLFVSYFLDKGEGALLNVTSSGGLVPCPYQNVYGATKHALQQFTEVLAWEYRGKGVVICTFAPAGVATEMTADEWLSKRLVGSKSFLMPAERAARIAVRAFRRGKLLTVPGIGNRAGLLLTRFLSRKAVAAVLGRAYEAERRPPRSTA
jgi:short-subunit dehydrogenase